MSTHSKSEPLGSLGLPSGDHWVRFHVEGDSITFEVAASAPKTHGVTVTKKPTGFVQKWGGSAQKITDSTDPWLTHINDKHLR